MSVGGGHPGFELIFAKTGETRAPATHGGDERPLCWIIGSISIVGADRITGQPAGADINLLDAWQLCTGNEDIIVAVIDHALLQITIGSEGRISGSQKNSQVHGHQFLGRLFRCSTEENASVLLRMRKAGCLCRPRNACGRCDCCREQQRTGRHAASPEAKAIRA